jgi:hypothetical protein
MNNLEKKALCHILNCLDKYDTHPVYAAISDEMIRMKIENPNYSSILSTFNHAAVDVQKPLQEAKEWIKILIEEVES